MAPSKRKLRCAADRVPKQTSKQAKTQAHSRTACQTDHHSGEAAGPPEEDWLPRDSDERPGTLSPDMSEAVLVPGLPMMLEERHRSYSLDSLPLLEDFSPGQPATERVSGLLHNARATILAINDIDRGPVPPPCAFPTSAFGEDHACRQPRRLHSPAAAPQQQQAHQHGSCAAGWQCSGWAEAAGAANQGPELDLHTEAVGPSAVTADQVTMWEGLDCLGLPELNSAELYAEAHVVPGMEGHSLEDLMDLMLPQVQAPDALPPLPRHIGQNPAPELPPRPPSALATGAAASMQACERPQRGAARRTRAARRGAGSGRGRERGRSQAHRPAKAAAGRSPGGAAHVQQPLPPAAAQPGPPATGGMRGLHLALARFRQMQEGKPGATVRAVGEGVRAPAEHGRHLDQQQGTHQLPAAARKVFSLRRPPRRLGQSGGSKIKGTRPSDRRQGPADAVAGGAEAGAASTAAAAGAGDADQEVAGRCAPVPGARARRAQSRVAAAEQPHTVCAAAGGADTELQMDQGVRPAPTTDMACGLGVNQHPAAPTQAAAAGAPLDPPEGQEGAAVPAVPISLPRLQAGTVLERMAAEASMLHSMPRHGRCVLVSDLLPPIVRLNGSARRGRPPGRVPPDMQKQAGKDKAGSCEVWQQEAAGGLEHSQTSCAGACGSVSSTTTTCSTILPDVQRSSALLRLNEKQAAQSGAPGGGTDQVTAQLAGAAVGTEESYERESGATTDVHSSSDHGRRAHAQQRTECITAQFLERGGFFNMPIEEAAKTLQVCENTLKRVCREVDIGSWPYRSRQKDQRLLQQIAKLETEPDMVVVLDLMAQSAAAGFVNGQLHGQHFQIEVPGSSDEDEG